MSTPQTTQDKHALNKRLETIGWGLFLIMLGGMAFVPKTTVREGIWSIGIGLILLGLNAARYYFKIKMSNGTIILGLIALASGVGDLIGVELPILEILIIVAGISILYKTFVQQGSRKEPGS